MDFFFKLYRDLPKQGPGSRDSALRAFKTIPNYQDLQHILDIGCGTGRHTILLAQNSSARITALEYYDQQIAILKKNIQEAKLSDRIEIVKGDMKALPGFNQKFDLIWSESSIYNIGFSNGLNYWKEYLQAGGYLVVSEVVWLTETPSQKIREWWQQEYSGIQTIDENKQAIDRCGYDLLAHFILPKNDWWDGYYEILEKRVAQYESQDLNDEQKEVIAATKLEIDMFKKYSDQYGYAFFVLTPSRH